MSTIEEKQKYLKENILSKGLDSDKFSEYLDHTTGGTFEIEQCTMEELKELVQGFNNSSENENQAQNNINYPSVPEDPNPMNPMNPI